MKQEILCPSCAVDLIKIIGKGAPGEYTACESGRAKRQYRCDYCGEDIKPLDHCVAFSIWTDAIPYHPKWEQDYIITKGED